MRSRPLLLVAAIFAFSSALPLSAGAEDALDPSRLDPAAAGAAAKAKPKKNKQQQASSGQAAAPGKPAPGKAENRQFGELEGWSPGKSPPKKEKKDDDTPRFGGRAPVSMGNNGNMSVGMPF